MSAEAFMQYCSFYALVDLNHYISQSVVVWASSSAACPQRVLREVCLDLLCVTICPDASSFKRTIQEWGEQLATR